MNDPAFLATHRMTNGWLATHAKAKCEWARISRNGKIHRVEQAIIRWNYYGGTWEKPDVVFVMACGPQRHSGFPVSNPDVLDMCARCDSKNISRPLDRQSNQR